MKIYISILICLVAFASLAFAQVDTMRLLEVGSVTAPGAITNWYFEDLNGDSIKEIILTTANSVNIYSGQTFSPIWWQEGFTNPKDLNFADINNDGLIDFSVKDTSHIYLIDPHHSTTIWTSPTLDSLYKCYTIGDRNGDNISDIVIINKEPFSRTMVQNNIDTVWVRIFDGPGYQYANGLTVLMSNYWYMVEGGNSYSNHEYPVTVTIAQLSSNGVLSNTILISTRIDGYNVYNPGSGSNSLNYGAIWIIDGDSLQFLRKFGTGEDLFQGILIQDAQHSSLVLGQFNNHYEGSQYNPCCRITRTLTLWKIQTDMLINIDTVWTFSNYSDPWTPPSSLRWIGCFMGDLLPGHDGDEIMFGDSDSIIVKTVPSITSLVNMNSASNLYTFITHLHGNRVSTYPDSNWLIFSTGQYDYSYDLFGLESGQHLATLMDQSININGSVDINSGYPNKLYSSRRDTLHFYTFAPRSGIVNPNFIPSTFFLSPNYPNPFNASTMIEYGLPETGPVKVEIFDILGRKVQTLIDETQSAGYHQVNWNGQDSPSGTYFYRFQAGEKSQTKKCLLLK